MSGCKDVVAWTKRGRSAAGAPSPGPNEECKGAEDGQKQDGPFADRFDRGAWRGLIRARVSLYRRDEPVADLRHGLQKPRSRRRIPKRLPDLLNRRIQALVELDELVLGPEAVLELLSGDDLAGLLEQSLEDAERLVLQPHLHAALAQLAGGEVDLEDAEAKRAHFSALTIIRSDSYSSRAE